MLRQLNEKDIDDVMKLWCDGNFKTHDFISNFYWIDKYKNIQDNLLRKSDTTIYEEYGKIKAFMSILDDGEIWAIFVTEDIKREGIGKILIQSAKERYDKLTVKIYEKNVIATMFFKAMEFNKIGTKIEESTSEIEYIMEWNKNQEEKTGFIYLDNSISEDVINKYDDNKQIDICMINIYSNIKENNVRCVDLKKYLQINKDSFNIIDHIGLIAALNDVFKYKKSVIYINYQHDYGSLSNVIKDYVLVKKINLKIALQKPFLIEGNKKLNQLEAIKKDYNNFSFYLCNYDEKGVSLSFKDAFKKRDEEFMNVICSKHDIN